MSDAIIAKNKTVQVEQDGTLSPANNDKIIESLRWIDTIHDFYPVNATARGENVRAILSRFYDDKFNEGDSFNEKDNNGIKNFLNKFSHDGNGLIIPSSIETSTEDYYNKNYNIITVGKNSVDIKQIIDKYGQKTAAQVLEQIGVPAYNTSAELQLCLNDRKFFKSSTDKTSFLANVILTFFFGANINTDVYFLIDAAAGRLDCMFQKIDQASTLINVLSIGDSAVTSVKDKTTKNESKVCGVEDYNNRFKRKVYLDGRNTIPYTNDGVPGKYEITSNTFTKGKFEIWYQDADLKFSKQNNAAARLYVKYGTGAKTKTWFTEFSILASKSPNSGASVGTLKKLILIINDIKRPENRKKAKEEITKFYKTETQFNLTPILCGMLDEPTIDKNDIIRFLYDYKRAGDHEQVNSAFYLYDKKRYNVIVLTGDLLCSLYARLIGQPCIYIHDGKYDMYRYMPAGEITEEQKKEKKLAVLIARKEFILGEMSKINIDAIKTKIEEITDQITKFLEEMRDNDDFESKLYKHIFSCLKHKTDKINEISLAYKTDEIIEKCRELNGITMATDLLVIETKMKELNDDYNKFNTVNKEMFAFSLHLTDPIVADHKKFGWPGLEYNPKTVKNILDYFIQFNKKNITSGVTRDKMIENKKNWVSRIGKEEYKILIDEFIHYIEKCNSYEKQSYDMDDIRNKAADMGKEIRDEIELKINDPEFGDSTYEDYVSIFDKIKAYIVTAIAPAARESSTARESATARESEAPATTATTAPKAEATEPATAPETAPAPAPETAPATATAPETAPETAPAAATATAEATAPATAPATAAATAVISSTLPINLKSVEEVIKSENTEFLKLMKYSLYHWFKQTYPENVTAMKLELSTEIHESPPPLERDKELTEAIKIARKAKFEQENLDLNNKIKILDSTINENDFKEILNYRLKDEHELFYGKPSLSATEMTGGALADDIQALLKTYYSNMQTEHIQELVDVYLYQSEKTNEEKETEIRQIFNYIYSIYPDDVYQFLYKGFILQSSAKVAPAIVAARTSVPETVYLAAKLPKTSTPRSRTKKLKHEKRIFKEIPSPNEVTKKRKHEESPSPKKQKKPRTENKENIDRPQLKAVRRNLFPRPEVSAQGGGARKRTRKNKNKRNKKTRQRHKKTRKNTTKKNKKAKGKHRTPRY